MVPDRANITTVIICVLSINLLDLSLAGSKASYVFFLLIYWICPWPVLKFVEVLRIFIANISKIVTDWASIIMAINRTIMSIRSAYLRLTFDHSIRQSQGHIS